MDSSNTTRTAHATQHEAQPMTVGHAGPTADRYASALERYVEAVAGNRTHPDAPPVGHALTFPPITVSDVMSRAVVSAYEGALFKEIAHALDRNGINSVPVIDEGHRVVGVVTASDLLARVGHSRPVPRGHRLGHHAENSRKQHGRTARELMTSPALTISPGTSISDAARQLTRYRVRSLPVVDRNGVLVGMVARADLIKLFLRSDEEIRNDVIRDVIRSDTVPGRGNVRVAVEEGVVTLSGRVATALAARGLAHDAARVPGVVDVHDKLDFDVNDVFLPLGH
jgi:CBS domain-containing protein